MESKELKKILDYHDNLYYNLNTQEISDEEYDAIKQKYLNSIHQEEYDYVPGLAKNNEYKHVSPMLSLKKIQITDKDLLYKEIKRLYPIVIEPKFDGLTVVAYENNVFVTRGNGIIGENITDNCNAIEYLKELKSNKYPLRMEVLIPKKDFIKINEERKNNNLKLYENSRNAAAGLLHNLDKNKIKGLKPYIYEVIGDTKKHSESLEELNVSSDIIAPMWKFNDSNIENGIKKAMDFINNFNRDELEYEIDGLVIKSDRNNSLNEFGITGHHPKNAIAVKFKAKGEWTTIKDVVWQVGKEGVITPIAEVEPIKLLGSTISRVTLHNINIINILNIKKNSDVYIIKANDVIPRIIESKNTDKSTRIISPSRCPVCNGFTKFNNDILYCTNSLCDAKILGKTIKLSSREALNIDGLSKETISKMIDYCIDKQIEYDFSIPFIFTKEMLLELPGFAEKSANNLYKEIQKAKNTELHRFLIASNIPLIGVSASETIASNFNTIEEIIDDINKNCVKLRAQKDFGEKMVDSIKKYAINNFNILLNKGIKIINNSLINNSKNNSVLNFVITGTFEKSRAEIKEIIKNSGNKVSDSVSSKTNYLLANINEVNTNKYKKAKELNINIINSLDELYKIIKIGDQ